MSEQVGFAFVLLNLAVYKTNSASEQRLVIIHCIHVGNSVSFSEIKTFYLAVEVTLVYIKTFTDDFSASYIPEEPITWLRIF